MTKHYCDICRRELNTAKDYEIERCFLKYGSQFLARRSDIYQLIFESKIPSLVTYEDVCGECMKKIDSYITELRDSSKKGE